MKHVYSLLNFEPSNHSRVYIVVYKLSELPGLGEYQCTFISFIMQDCSGMHP